MNKSKQETNNSLMTEQEANVNPTGNLEEVTIEIIAEREFQSCGCICYYPAE